MTKRKATTDLRVDVKVLRRGGVSVFTELIDVDANTKYDMLNRLITDIYHHYDIKNLNKIEYMNRGPGLWLIYTLAKGVSKYMDVPRLPIYVSYPQVGSIMRKDFYSDYLPDDYNPSTCFNFNVIYYGNTEAICNFVKTIRIKPLPYLNNDNHNFYDVTIIN
jgi:hypothetical protein